MLEYKDGVHGQLVHYYRHVRVGRRVTKKYVACGAEALRLAAEDERLRAVREAAGRADRLRREAALRAAGRRVARADALLSQWSGRVTAIWREFMCAMGYHKHNNEWRRRRMAESERGAPPAVPVGRPGDPEVTAIVRIAFDANLNLIEVCGGRLAQRVVNALVDLVAGKDPYFRESVHRQLEEVCSDLEDRDPTPLGRLLARRAAVCWLATYEAELACLKCEREGLEIKVADYYGRRHDRAQKRFLMACRELALARRLAVPGGSVSRPSIPALPSPAPAASSEPALTPAPGPVVAEGLDDRWGQVLARARALALAGGNGHGHENGNGNGRG
jgi:hypothetical protein